MGMWQVRQKPPSWEVPASHPKLHSPSQPCMRRHCALMPVLSWAVHSFITPWWWAWGYRLGLHGNQETWFSYLATSHTSDLVHPQLHKGTEYGLCLCYNPKKEQLKTHASCSQATGDHGGPTDHWQHNYSIKPRPWMQVSPSASPKITI